MDIREITPMLLTYNEQHNVRETLGRLRWASQVIVVDSFSTDQTCEILSEFKNVTVVQHAFENFAAQCNFGLTQITSTWVLSLDADYKCSEDLPDELNLLDPEYVGYETSFRYGVFGHSLRSTLYPPRVVLYQRKKANYQEDGHAHRVCIAGDVGRLNSSILHDDWKPLSSWFYSQIRYAELEASKLAASNTQLGWKDRIRKLVLLAPILTPFYCLFVKRLILDGWSGIYYTLQRTLAELVLSLVLIDRKLRP